MLLEDSPAVLSQCLLCEEMGYSCELSKGEFPFLMKDIKVIRCKSENHLPIMAVSKEPRVPDVPSKASGGRLHFPGVQAEGDQSHDVSECSSVTACGPR